MFNSKVSTKPQFHIGKCGCQWKKSLKKKCTVVPGSSEKKIQAEEHCALDADIDFILSYAIDYVFAGVVAAILSMLLYHIKLERRQTASKRKE